ncbi:bifunctional ligase/repressor BirA [Anaerotignum neopropionicum]|uniref:Bifunctional ligase/repressor BirA n=1 Tax=Anaerotignum neopropionicum TaxID=36847 RepID=A0A136WC11_9FIRM|nr:biotin--[acetyl-CoA-carboxylase] ligase [Anaerotignum neopropionicum]KXL52042.1 bifunctional ligase/repressor BirA [Anaerotignum neopropionicum]
MYRILEILRREQGFLSGQDIGEQLRISRAAVWKGIKKLREEGYEIEAVTNKGYRLILHDTMYNEKEIAQGLSTKKLGRTICFYKETTTTNGCLREIALDGGDEGTIAVAERMTAGRGRRGRHWEAPAGSGIWMSILLRPNIFPSEASVLTLLAGLAVCQALEAETGLSPKIKWPNDILLNEKKLVGILTEMDCEMQQTHFVIVGIGINVNTTEFPEGLGDIATSLYLESGRTFSRKNILQRVLVNFESLYEEFIASHSSFAPFLFRYKEKCSTINQEVKVLGKETFFAQAVDITPEGELVVIRKDNGKQEVVFSGEVSIRGGKQGE